MSKNQEQVAADTYPPVAARTANRMPVSYVRQQKGHSLILNLLIVGPITLFITTIYYSVSPNHFWHA